MLAERSKLNALSKRLKRSIITQKRKVVRRSFRFVFFFFQAEDGIRDGRVTGVQTCALPISTITQQCLISKAAWRQPFAMKQSAWSASLRAGADSFFAPLSSWKPSRNKLDHGQIGRASCRERVEMSEVAGSV